MDITSGTSVDLLLYPATFFSFWALFLFDSCCSAPGPEQVTAECKSLSTYTEYVLHEGDATALIIVWFREREGGGKKSCSESLLKIRMHSRYLQMLTFSTGVNSFYHLDVMDY